MNYLKPTPEIAIRKCIRIKQRKCVCGECELCKGRLAKARWYKRFRAAQLGPDIDENKLNAYWERVKTC